jgi:cytochrome c oxidase subunit 3
MAGAVQHDYHLVNPSPWPLVGSLAAMIMMLGAIAWGHSGAAGIAIGGFDPVTNEPAGIVLKGNWMFFIGLAGVLFTMAGWWRDVTKESLTGENTMPVVRIGLRYGMILFIASEVMFFVAWFWAFFGAALFPGAADPIMLADGTQMLNADGLPAYLQNDSRFHVTGNTWPPVGVEPLNAWHLPLINTLILLLSGTTVTWAHHALLQNDRSGLLQGLLITILLGAFFSFLQAVEYYEAIHYELFTFSGSIYGSSFFMATGFHGAHVLIGTIFLIVCYFRALQNHFTPDRHFGFESAAWYWHFVDVVWLFLFAMIYVLGNAGLLPTA